jgi:hypothetical protein
MLRYESIFDTVLSKQLFLHAKLAFPGQLTGLRARKAIQK